MTAKRPNLPPYRYPHPSGLRPVSPPAPPARPPTKNTAVITCEVYRPDETDPIECCFFVPCDEPVTVRLVRVTADTTNDVIATFRVRPGDRTDARLTVSLRPGERLVADMRSGDSQIPAP